MKKFTLTYTDGSTESKFEFDTVEQVVEKAKEITAAEAKLAEATAPAQPAPAPEAVAPPPASAQPEPKVV